MLQFTGFIISNKALYVAPKVTKRLDNMHTRLHARLRYLSTFLISDAIDAQIYRVCLQHALAHALRFSVQFADLMVRLIPMIANLKSPNVWTLASLRSTITDVPQVWWYDTFFSVRWSLLLAPGVTNGHKAKRHSVGKVALPWHRNRALNIKASIAKKR